MQQEHVIALQSVSKTFAIGFWRKRIQAVKDLSLSVHRGEVFGLIGPNGAGKTTTIKVICSLIAPSQGAVRVFGAPASSVSCRKRMGFLPEISHYYNYLTATEILEFYAQLYQLDKATRKTRIPALLDRVGLGNSGHKRLGQFSKGMLQRLGLAQALIGDPQLVILDEPQSGLDPFGRKDVADIIAQCRDEGRTVFFSSHILPDVERICDRVALLKQGSLLQVGSLEELLGNQQRFHLQCSGTLDAQLQQTLLSLHIDLSPINDTTNSHQLSFTPKNIAPNDLLTLLITHNMQITQFTQERENLESLFVRLSQG